MSDRETLRCSQYSQRGEWVNLWMGQLIPAPLLRLAKVLEHVHQLKKKKKRWAEKRQTAAPGHINTHAKTHNNLSLQKMKVTLEKSWSKPTSKTKQLNPGMSLFEVLDVISDCHLSLAKMTHSCQMTSHHLFSLRCRKYYPSLIRLPLLSNYLS